MPSNTDMKDCCALCGGINLPHPMDQYHRFLQQLQYADEHLQTAKKISMKLPSIQIQLDHTLDSMESLRKEAKQI